MNNKNRLLMCADYPYYRDSVDDWHDKLEKLKQLKINVVTCYIPWRHHLVNLESNKYDFKGNDKPNTNLIRFIEECESCGLNMIIKPGPFIHAEVNYGGLPDELNNIDYEKKESLNGELCKYERKKGCYYIPSSFSKKFINSAEKWYEAVINAVSSHFYPNGCIVGIQLMNEGIFSDANSLIKDWDYSKSAIDGFSNYLKNKYKTIKYLNSCLATDYKDFNNVTNEKKSLVSESIRKEWIDYQYKSLYETYKRFQKKCVGTVPVIANYNFPLNSPEGVSTWISKVRPEYGANIMYGFTSWGGNIVEDKEKFYTYLLVAKREKGIHMECNWGFSKLYEKEYESSIVPFYEAALSIANGAKGYNIYTGAATSKWDENLDNIYERPYPDCSPIDSQGKYNEKKSNTIYKFNSYLEKYGDEIINSVRNNDCAYLINPQDYYDGCLNAGKENIALDTLYWFQHNMRAYSYDYDLISTDNFEKRESIGYKVIFMAEGINLSKEVKEKLDDFQSNGGKIVYLNSSINYDINHYSNGFTKLIKDIDVSFGVYSDDYETQAWGIHNDDKLTKHIFIFSRSNEEKEHSVKIKNDGIVNELKVLLPQESAAIVRLVNNEVKGFFIKGENDLAQKMIKPKLSYGDYVYESNEYGDVLNLA